MRPLLLTPGEPAGIGPEIACRLVSGRPDLVLVADPDLLARTLTRLSVDRPVRLVDELAEFEPEPETVACLPVKMIREEVPGQLEPANATYVLECLRTAADECMAGRAAGLVTGPVHKGVINEAGFSFRGHTEFLAELAEVRQVVMLLVAGDMRVALATTHLPLVDVPAAITSARLQGTLEILDKGLKAAFGLTRPRIAVLGLNPHAGENGHLGREEIEIIEPLLDRLREQGMDLVGPLPADTAFVPERVKGFDAILAMYHDQGLPVLKYAGFGQAVNTTLGLPYIRTSVDHGTALDIAGTGQADSGSLTAAVDLAARLSG
ncbi:MAG: 4-hydroxythreonine-4-phosphate dehydrogenase PdxA [Wenzhouxiangella sp.]